MTKNVLSKDFAIDFKGFFEEDAMKVMAYIIAAQNITFFRLYQTSFLSFVTPMYKNDRYFRYPIKEFQSRIECDDTVRNIIEDTFEKLLVAYEKQSVCNDGDLAIAKLGYASKSLHSEWDIENLIDIEAMEFILVIDQENKRLDCIYSKQYSSCQIEAIVNVFFYILKNIYFYNIRKVKHIPITTESEELALINMSKGRRAATCYKTSIIELLNKSFKDFAQKPCLIYSEQHPFELNDDMKVCTYGEIEDISRNTARLINIYRKESEMVAIIARNPLLLTLGYIGCFRAGIPLLSLDSSIPKARLRRLILESNVKIIISDVVDEKEYDDIHIITLKEIKYCNEDKVNCDNSVKKTGYFMYTSGTTDNPKKFFVTEQALLNYTLKRIQNYNITSEDNILQILSPSFDGFFSNFFSSLLTGATLVMPGVNCCSNYKVISFIVEKYKITHFSIVPCIFEQIIEKDNIDKFSSLKSIVFGGDFASPSLIKKCMDIKPDIHLINEYGPSENCVASTVNLNLNASDVHNIGRPLPGIDIYILNCNNEMLPINIKGEICVGGIQLANGYISKKNANFIANPYSEGELLFKTGDQGYWLENGTIWLSGRKDNQVNINGCRIELEEVEQAIKTHKKVKQAVISVGIENNKNILYADIIGEAELTSRMIREYLVEIIPTYMIPQRIYISNQIQLSSHGKPIRKKMDVNTCYGKDIYEMAIKITDVWRGVLDKDISIYDDFFECGGSSLTIVVFVNEFQELIASDIKIKDVFKYSTAIELAQYIMTKGETYV